MNVDKIVNRGAALLSEAGIAGARREAMLLWEAAHPRRYADYDSAIAGEWERDFFELVARRAAREPMSHLRGYRDFWEHRFAVSGDVLDPRPETEALVAAALEQPFDRVLDLGTGSGCILLSLMMARQSAHGVGSDLSDAALAVARQNVGVLELETRVDLIQSDWYGSISGQFDLIVSNPPYIALAEMDGLAPELAHEPRMALTDEGDGLSAYRIIVAGAPKHLRPGGWLMVEIGPSQGGAVARMVRDAGFDNVTVLPDLDGRDRVVRGENPRR